MRAVAMHVVSAWYPGAIVRVNMAWYIINKFKGLPNWSIGSVHLRARAEIVLVLRRLVLLVLILLRLSNLLLQMLDKLDAMLVQVDA